MNNFYQSDPPKNICILRLSALGDVSHVVPVVRTVQKVWPDTKITWVIGKLEYRLVADLEGVEFVVFDKAQGWAANRTVWRQLRGRRFDVLLNMQAALRASLLSLGIRAKTKVGFDRIRARDCQWLFTNKKIRAEKNQHVLDSFFGFLQAIGISDREMKWDIPIESQAAEYADDLVGNEAVMVINPCSSNRARNFRNWHANGYAAVADYAQKTYGLKVFVTGGPAEDESTMADAIVAACQTDVVNLVGKTSIQQLFALINRAQVVIAPDTGPAHLASAAGTPVIGLYMTANPYRTQPYNYSAWVVNRYPDAVEKYLGKSVESVRWGTRVRTPDAADLIGIHEVIGMLDKVMASSAHSH